MPQQRDASVTVRPAPAPVGAEILGVDLSRTVGPAVFARILEAFEQHGVIVFRDQKLTPEQQIAFSRLFGELEDFVLNQYALPGHPEITLISNVRQDGRNIGIVDAGNHWHSDSIYKATPSRCSLLYAREVPTEDGEPLGDTLFVPTTGLYENLPPEKQAFLKDLKAVHWLSNIYKVDAVKPRAAGAPSRDPLTPEQLEKTPHAVHPVIRTHPTTGRKCLYVHASLTAGFVGLSEEEGKRLLQELCGLCTSPERIYRHRWKVGDLVVWDNCSTMHHATFNYAWPKHRRLMHRTSVVGSVPY